MPPKQQKKPAAKKAPTTETQAKAPPTPTATHQQGNAAALEDMGLGGAPPPVAVGWGRRQPAGPLQVETPTLDQAHKGAGGAVGVTDVGELRRRDQLATDREQADTANAESRQRADDAKLSRAQAAIDKYVAFFGRGAQADGDNNAALHAAEQKNAQAAAGLNLRDPTNAKALASAVKATLQTRRKQQSEHKGEDDDATDRHSHPIELSSELAAALDAL